MNYNEGKKLLFEGVANGDLDLVKLALKIVKDVNIINEYGMTPLHNASRYGNSEIVKYLISKGVDINIKDNDGMTPLHYASKYGRLEIIKYLISNGADISVNIKNKDGNTSLHLASQEGDLDIVKYLITMGSDINIQNNDGETPLKGALICSHFKIMRYIKMVSLLKIIFAGYKILMTKNISIFIIINILNKTLNIYDIEILKDYFKDIFEEKDNIAYKICAILSQDKYKDIKYLSDNFEDIIKTHYKK